MLDGYIASDIFLISNLYKEMGEIDVACYSVLVRMI